MSEQMLETLPSDGHIAVPDVVRGQPSVSIQPTSWSARLAGFLFFSALLIYLATRLVGLTKFPIYFFTDEAIQTLLAADLLRDGFHSPDGVFLPTYFKNVYQYNLSVSVYLQIIPYLLFGKSVWITRLTPMLVTILAAVSVALLLRDGFCQAHWWVGTLLLSITPAWFLHSRTAFEVTLMVSFYAAGLYFYVRYRSRSPRNIFPALVFFSLAFYSYSPGQMVVATSAILFLALDATYHWRQRWTLIWAFGLLILLALPYARFRWQHPTAFSEHLAWIGSYWAEPLPLAEKLRLFLARYLYGLSPAYWIIPNQHDLIRHVMRGYPHLHVICAPLMGIGLWLTISRLQLPEHRTTLAALLAAPSGAALLDISITRALVMVIPAAILAGLGANALLRWLEKFRLQPIALGVGAFAVLSAINLWMLRDALVNAPTWFTDYGLGGMQYGAQQVFSATLAAAKELPGVEFSVSPAWANGADVLARFFLPQNAPVRLEGADAILFARRPLEKRVFVVTPDEYAAIIASQKFAQVHVHQTLPYPDGRPGFYFLELRYVDSIDEIFAAEAEERRQLITSGVIIDGSYAWVRHSRLDMGQPQDLWDGREQTVARTLEANPFVIEVRFEQPKTLRGLHIVIGDTEAQAAIRAYPPEGEAIFQTQVLIDGSVQNPGGDIAFPTPLTVQKLYLEIYDLRQQEPAHVHIWEIQFY